MSTDRHYLLAVLKNYDPDLVVIESCGLAGWVHDICTEEGYEVLVCNPNQEAWKWKRIKCKTDRDDALKLAKLAVLEQLVPVYIPCRQQREYRRLVKYRQVVLGRINRVQNNIRAIFAQRGIEMVRGQKAWALERLELIAEHRKPLAKCSLDDLWRGELDLELIQLEHLRQHQHEVHKRLKALAAPTSVCSCSRRSPAWAARRRKWSWHTWTIPIASRTRGRSLPTPGMVPRRYQSGEMDRHGRIHKRGPVPKTPAQCTGRSGLADALRDNPWAKSVYDRLTSGQKDSQEEGDRGRGS